MAPLGVWLEAGVGGRAPMELVDAARELTWRQRVRVNWQVHLGRAAADPAGARYAIALIRAQRRRTRIKSRRLMMAYQVTLFGLLTAFMVLVTADSVTTGGKVVGAILALTCGFSATYPVLGLQNAGAAEQANRVRLDEAGLSYANFEDPSPAKLSPLGIGLSAVVIAGAFCAVYATRSQVFGHTRIFGHQASASDGLASALIYTALLMGGFWFFNRDQRAAPMGEPGHFLPYRPYRP